MIACLARPLVVVLAAFALVSGISKAADQYEVHVMIEQTGAFAFVGAKQPAYRLIEPRQRDGWHSRANDEVRPAYRVNPQTAVQLATQLMAQKVTVIVGPALAADCSAIMPLVQQSGPIDMCFSPIVTPVPRSYAFRAAPAIEDVQPVVVRYFANRGLKNIALITSTDASGQTFDQKFDATMNRLEFRDLRWSLAAI